MTTSTINFTRINNDTNGNPRFVCHFLSIDNDYDIALQKAKTIGGKKYHNKSYGGGIVFQSYNIADKEKLILGLKLK